MYRIAHAQLLVHNQDEALEFYTKKLGMEVRADVSFPELGGFRWLVVGVVGQPDVSLALTAIPPLGDEDLVAQVRSVIAKGLAGGLFLTTDDCQASYEEFSSRGVAFQETPERRPYGIDAAFRDPSGNELRLTQLLEPAVR